MPIALWGSLAGRFPGPILVIGGGPSVSVDLARLDARPVAVISANAHGFRQSLFPPTHALVLDDHHSVTEESMEALIRPYGAPIIGPNWWADYRMNDWRGGMNSGLTAICAAVLMGGNPVIVTGLDGFAGGYFHAPSHTRIGGQDEETVRRQTRTLVQYVGDCPVRPMSGYLLDHFPRFDGAETFGAPPPRPWWVEKAIAAQAVQMVSIRRPRFVFLVAKVPHGRRLLMSETEARELEVRRYAVRRTVGEEVGNVAG